MTYKGKKGNTPISFKPKLKSQFMIGDRIIKIIDPKTKRVCKETFN